MTAELLRPRRCPVCGEGGAACGPRTEHQPVDLPEETAAMRESQSNLVRVKRTTESGSEYYTKLPADQARREPANKAQEAPKPVTSRSSRRAAKKTAAKTAEPAAGASGQAGAAGGASGASGE